MNYSSYNLLCDSSITETGLKNNFIDHYSNYKEYVYFQKQYFAYSWQKGHDRNEDREREIGSSVYQEASQHIRPN